jgi:hypothetical protein
MKNAIIILLTFLVVFLLYNRKKQLTLAFENSWYRGQNTALRDVNEAAARCCPIEKFTGIQSDSLEFRKLISWGFKDTEK